jgi:hypothetical protein
VIAYGKGGALETIKDIDKDKPSGIFSKNKLLNLYMNQL